MEEIFEKFKNREVKAKQIFYIQEIDKVTAYDFIRKYHYLGDAKFFCTQAFGLFLKETDELVGSATFSQPQGAVSLKGWFGLDNSATYIYELSRLCMLPSLNGTNATSFLLGGSIRELKKQGFCKAVTTLADSTRHVGSIYQVCNFKYYGMTDAKSDFCTVVDGKLKINPRMKTEGVEGVWIARSRKHRYCYILDDTLKINYEEQPRPSTTETTVLECCGGTNKVYDKRFNHWYTCPRCTGKLDRIYTVDDLLDLL